MSSKAKKLKIAKLIIFLQLNLSHRDVTQLVVNQLNLGTFCQISEIPIFLFFDDTRKMENKNKNLLETDAVGTGADVVAYTGGSELVDADDTANRAFNNNMVLANQTNSAAVLNFEKCSGITLGTVINVGWSPGSSALVPAAGNATVKEDESAYKKTPTIKTMMETEKAISTAFLDNVSGNFGTRWREVAVLLEINPLFVDRMYEDYYNKDGTKEVTFQSKLLATILIN